MSKIEFDESQLKIRTILMKGMNIDEFFSDDIKKYLNENGYYPMTIAFIDKEQKMPLFLFQDPENVNKKEIHQPEKLRICRGRVIPKNPTVFCCTNFAQGLCKICAKFVQQDSPPFFECLQEASFY